MRRLRWLVRRALGGAQGPETCGRDRPLGGPPVSGREEIPAHFSDAFFRFFRFMFPICRMHFPMHFSNGSALSAHFSALWRPESDSPRKAMQNYHIEVEFPVF